MGKASAKKKKANIIQERIETEVIKASFSVLQSFCSGYFPCFSIFRFDEKVGARRPRNTCCCCCCWVVLRAGMPPSSRLGSFWFRKLRPQSVRQRHITGPQFYKRKFFHFPKGYHRMHLRIGPRILSCNETAFPQSRWYNYLPGDVQTKPQEDYSLMGRPREDRCMYAWKPRGRLHLHQMGGGSETFVCFRCGYPVKSHLVAVLDDNWDYRMCYRCYNSTIRQGRETDLC